MGDSSKLSQTSTYEGESAQSRGVHWVRLHVIHPRACGRIVELDAGGAVLGREPGVGGIELAHSTVSRRHFEVVSDPRTGTLVGADLGSHNGSWINCVPAGRVPRPLEDGDVLRLGEVIVVVERGDNTLHDDPRVSRDAVPGSSAAAMRLRTELARAAGEPTPVLLLGESGTGKESTAAEVHRLSERRGPLVVANCAALNAALVESQLFGHERGAFTGAARSNVGLFRSADGGSLVLDEVGELPLELQPKLLRAVEQGEVAPLGGDETREVDVRIVAATNRDLVDEVEAGRFRRDLYARLSLVVIRLPSLRARRADVLGWFDRLYRRWSTRRDGRERPLLEFTAEAVEMLLLQRWPENLRGLDRVVHELATSTADERITRADLARVLPTSVGIEADRDEGPASDPPRRDKPEREELLAALEAHQWNVAAVGRYFGRDRRQVYRWMEALGIEPPR